MNKKQLILNAAKSLFNEKGYYNVTIRMIALELNMSSGNLNYHFKKREDIFEALYFEMVAVFDERLEKVTTSEFSLPQILADIETSMFRMVDYTFFWTDLYQLLNVSSTVKKHFRNVYTLRKQAYRYLFNELIKNNLMKVPSFPLEYEFLTERMLSYSNTWLYETNLYTTDFSKNNLSHQANLLLGMLYPFLSDIGRKEYETLFPNYFSK